MTLTPSPWRRWWAPISWLGVSAPVSTRRMRPCVQHVRHAVAHAGLQPAYATSVKPNALHVEVGGLRGVADPELDVVDAVERHQVLAGGAAGRRRAPWSRCPPLVRRRRFMIALSERRLKRDLLQVCTRTRPRMDDIDRQIVALLRQDARRSFQSIGLRVSLSAPAVKRRVDRLEAEGVHHAATPRSSTPARFGWDDARRSWRCYCEGRMAAAEVRDGARAPSRGGRGLHGGRRGERDAARARARHGAPRGGARADPRRSPASRARRRRSCCRRCSSGRSRPGRRR